jgi:hypothetical protein
MQQDDGETRLRPRGSATDHRFTGKSDCVRRGNARGGSNPLGSRTMSMIVSCLA